MSYPPDDLHNMRHLFRLRHVSHVSMIMLRQLVGLYMLTGEEKAEFSSRAMRIVRLIIGD